jgi:hypothetical protein
MVPAFALADGVFGSCVKPMTLLTSNTHAPNRIEIILFIDDLARWLGIGTYK